jgi:hypothetical protein
MIITEACATAVARDLATQRARMPMARRKILLISKNANESFVRSLRG